MILEQSPSRLIGENDPDAALFSAAEAVRREVEDTLASGTISSARLERLEETLASHVRLYTTTAPTKALSGLLVDFMDVRRIAAQRQPAVIQARLSEVIALLGTLAADALMKLGRINASKAWYGTSRIAADDSRNAELRARVRAQEAMLPYYYGHPSEAVRLAREAQEILGGLPRAAGALAEAAEARALARLKSAVDARAAILRAECIVAETSDPDTDDAFRFGDRRLLFYSSTTFSNLGDIAQATDVQDQALALYGDKAGLIDPALIRFDQAQILLSSGDMASAGELVEGAVQSVPAGQRTLIFGARLGQFLESVPIGHRVHRMLTDLRQDVVEGIERAKDAGG
jgi:tetratricopeptide (TPR) repeat protein